MSKLLRGLGAVIAIASGGMLGFTLQNHYFKGRAAIFLRTINNGAGTMYGVCGKDDLNLNKIASVNFEDKYSSSLTYNFYNIENPEEYLKGDDAIAVEKGPYMLKKHSVKYGVGFRPSALTESATPLADGAIEYNVADLYIPLDKNTEVTSTSITRDASDLSLSWTNEKRETIASYDKAMPSHASMNDKITNLSPMYQTIVGEINDEFSLVLSMMCTPKQIENVFMADSKPQCSVTDINDMEKEDCSCCMLREMYDANGKPAGNKVCDEYLDEAGPLMSELSLLAYYDNGVVVKEKGDAKFSGVGAFDETIHKQKELYSPIIQSHSVNDILFGYPSAYMGKVIPNLFFAQSKKTMKTKGVTEKTLIATEILTGGMDAELPIQVGDLAVYTKNVGKVCLSTCAAADTLIGSPLDFMCDGSASERHEASTVDEVLLGGIDCKPYSATYATMKMCNEIDINLAADPSDTSNEQCVCADGSDDYKTTGCCLASGLYNGFDLTANGCLYPVEGVLGSNYAGRYTGNSAAKPTVDLGESSEALIARESGKTASLKHAQFMCPARAVGESLFIPEHKAFGKYEQFDGSDSHVTYHHTGNRRMRQNDASHSDVTTSSVGVNAFSTNFYPATGSSSYFNEVSLTSGHTHKMDFPVYMDRLKAPLMFREDWEERPMICDAMLCHRISRLKPLPNNFIGTNVTNLQGVGMPFDGVKAIGSFQGPNQKGRPTYYHNPLYIDGDVELVSQQNNSHVDSADGNGIKIYRPVDSSADPGAFAPDNADYQLLSNTTDATKAFEAYIDLEPATGLGVRSRMKYGVSHSIWECDPDSNEKCKLAKYSDNSGNCYDSDYPCSASNVLSPKVIGGKITPWYWFEDFKQEVDDKEVNVLSRLALVYHKIQLTYAWMSNYSFVIFVSIGLPMMLQLSLFAPAKEWMKPGPVGGQGQTNSAAVSSGAGSSSKAAGSTASATD